MSFVRRTQVPRFLDPISTIINYALIILKTQAITYIDKTIEIHANCNNLPVNYISSPKVRRWLKTYPSFQLTISIVEFIACEAK